MPQTADQDRPALLARLGAMLARGRGHALAALGVRLSAAGLAYLLQILLARVLGPADYGTYNITWNILTIGGFLATLGFSELAVRFLAQYHARNEFALASGFLRTGLMVTTIGALMAALAGFLMAPLMTQAYGPLAETLLRLGLLALPFFALTDYLEGVARSQGWTIRALTPPYVVRQGLIILIVLGLAVATPPVAPQTVMLATVIASALAALAHVLLVSMPVQKALPSTPPAYDLAGWRRAAGPTLLADLAMLARLNVDLIVLGLFVSPTEVGQYFAATRLASLLGLIEFAIRAGMGHRFARAAQEADPLAIARVYSEARRMALVPGLLASLALMLASPYVLRIFGPDFVAASPLAALLITAVALRLIIGPADEALAMSGHPGLVWRANGLAALTMGLGTALLAPHLGASGAALANILGALTGGLLVLVYLRRHLGIHPFRRERVTP